ncbi:MAG: tyrosine-type recombinase/integrase family protein [Clostridia bacterium]|nr:tyrosine-type recombinase/integrase family protein [Clostridia bacterium]
MKNYKRKKRTTEADNETLLLEQIKNLTTLIKELKSTPLNVSGNREKKSEIEGNPKFSQKEIKDMPRLKDFKIRVKNNRYYEIRFRRYGYNVSFSSTNFEVAKRKAFDWLNTFEEQIKPNVHFTVLSKSDSEHFNISKNIIFKQFADDYVYNIKKKHIKETTFRSYRVNYENYISPVYGKLKLSEIKPVFIQRHLDKINEKTPRACEDVKMLLNNIFDYAVNNGIIERNPIKAVYIQKHERKNGIALSLEQERKFVSDIKGNKYENYFLKMLYSGVRPTEVITIQENLVNNTLTVKNSKLKSYQKNLYRILPIFPKYKKSIRNYNLEKANLEQLRIEFKKYLPNHTLKDLRHTFTTRARECGIDNELVAVWTGHSLGNITSSVYTHFSMEFQQEQAKKLIY